MEILDKLFPKQPKQKQKQTIDKSEYTDLSDLK